MEATPLRVGVRAQGLSAPSTSLRSSLRCGRWVVCWGGQASEGGAESRGSQSKRRQRAAGCAGRARQGQDRGRNSTPRCLALKGEPAAPARLRATEDATSFWCARDSSTCAARAAGAGPGHGPGREISLNASPHRALPSAPTPGRRLPGATRRQGATDNGVGGAQAHPTQGLPPNLRTPGPW
jgi:hypothetical protein